MEKSDSTTSQGNPISPEQHCPSNPTGAQSIRKMSPTNPTPTTIIPPHRSPQTKNPPPPPRTPHPNLQPPLPHLLHRALAPGLTTQTPPPPSQSQHEHPPRLLHHPLRSIPNPLFPQPDLQFRHPRLLQRAPPDLPSKTLRAPQPHPESRLFLGLRIPQTPARVALEPVPRLRGQGCAAAPDGDRDECAWVPAVGAGEAF